MDKITITVTLTADEAAMLLTAAGLFPSIKISAEKLAALREAQYKLTLAAAKAGIIQ